MIQCTFWYFLKQKQQRLGEMAQLVKHWPHKKLGMIVCSCNPSDSVTGCRQDGDSRTGVVNQW